MTIFKKNNLEVKIIPIGGLFVTNKPMLLQTVLGSCVAVILYDRKGKNSGMNHIVLPGSIINYRKDEDFFNKKDLRYGIFSLEKLIYDIQKLGSLRRNLTARLYGASYVNSSLYLPIQKQNVEFVKAFLNMSKIPIIDEMTLQKEALKIIFNTESEEVEIIKLPPLNANF